MTCVIVVPLYTFDLEANEWVAIDRAMEEFPKAGYRVCFALPEGLESSLLDRRYSDFDVELFDAKYFAGISGYNALMLSEEFYARFLKYDFLLTYQADCYVFEASRLKEWFNYDYVGAPWIAKLRYSKSYYRLYHSILCLVGRLRGVRSKVSIYGEVGNGGLSLRRVELFHKIAQSERKSIDGYLSDKKNHIFNEDVFWSFEPHGLGYDMKKPNATEALGFSFDKNPARSFELAQSRLPMGCHGWNKPSHIGFWSAIIECAE